MRSLDKAIGEQMLRYSESTTEEIKPKSESYELNCLLRAFLEVINAYLARTEGESKPHRVSDTFASNG